MVLQRFRCRRPVREYSDARALLIHNSAACAAGARWSGMFSGACMVLRGPCQVQILVIGQLVRNV
jgi:hypothetical protein